MSESIYRKYRPKNFSKIIGQEHIVRTLTNAIKNDRIGHAYLFTGPRGTGKTSIARILAKTVNCEKSKEAISCEKCPACKVINEGRSLDIIEIDAASNTGVDNIRELRETVALPPTSLKYKAYIIDEVHMLSTGAFNALLKTLEEPPRHVIFILATTEIHKVPETIISRCQRFDFSRLPIQNIIEKLSLIAKEEKIKIEKEALEMIALSAEGGMRDAESLLSQIISLEDKNITVSEVKEITGATDRKFVEELARLIIEKNSASAISKINSLLEEGYDLQVFNKSFINYLRQLMLLKISPELRSHFSFEMTQEQVSRMLEQSKKIELSRIISSINLFLEAHNKILSFMLPQLPLEIAIIKATQTFPETINNEQETQNREDIPQVKQASIKSTPPSEENASICQSSNEAIRKAGEEKRAETSPKNIADLEIGKVRESWNKLLSDVRPLNHSINALLLNCQILGVKGNMVTIGTPFSFYQERLDDPINKLTIETVFSKILGSEIHVRAVIDKSISIKKEELSAEEPAGQQDSLLNSALEIMGGRLIGDLSEETEK